MTETDNLEGPSSNERIAALAYQIYLDQGCPDGHDHEHWVEAERRLTNGQELPMECKIVASLQGS